jgi:hypothetical protein
MDRRLRPSIRRRESDDRGGTAIGRRGRAGVDEVRSRPNSPRVEEWIKQQLDKFPAVTEERWAEIAAIVAGSRQRAMNRIDQFDRSA